MIGEHVPDNLGRRRDLTHKGEASHNGKASEKTGRALSQPLPTPLQSRSLINPINWEGQVGTKQDRRVPSVESARPGWFVLGALLVAISAIGSPDNAQATTWVGTAIDIEDYTQVPSDHETWHEIATTTYTFSADGTGSWAGSFGGEYHSDLSEGCTIDQIWTGSGEGPVEPLKVSYKKTSQAWGVTATNADPHEKVPGSKVRTWAGPNPPCKNAVEEGGWTNAVNGGSGTIPGGEGDQVIFGTMPDANPESNWTHTRVFNLRRVPCDESYDSDGDGWPDCEESRQGTDPYNPNLGPPGEPPSPGDPPQPPGDGDSGDGEKEDGSDAVSCFEDRFSRGIAERVYKARVPVKWAPDADLFRFTPQITFEYDGRCARVTGATAFGSVDWGVDTYVLELLGFTVRYDPAAEHATPLGAQAFVGGDFDVNFAWLTLFGRAKIVGPLKKRFNKGLSKRIEKLLGRDDYNAFEQGLNEVMLKLRFEATRTLEKHLAKLSGPLPDQLALPLERWVTQRVDAVFDDWEARVKVAFSRGNFADLTADEVGSAIFNRLTAALVGFTLPNDFSVWSPELQIGVAADGTVIYTDLTTFINPLLDISLLQDDVRRFRNVAHSIAAEAAGGLNTHRFARGKPSVSRIPGEAGKVTVLIGQIGGSRARTSRRRAKRILAKGSVRFNRSGWKALKLRPTRLGKHAFRRRKRQRLSITTVFKPLVGAATKKTLTVRVG